MTNPAVDTSGTSHISSPPRMTKIPAKIFRGLGDTQRTST